MQSFWERFVKNCKLTLRPRKSVFMNLPNRYGQMLGVEEADEGSDGTSLNLYVMI